MHSDRHHSDVMGHSEQVTPVPKRMEVAEGDAQDRCPLCGIVRVSAGYIRETCGDTFMDTGCFVTSDGIVTHAPDAA